MKRLLPLIFLVACGSAKVQTDLENLCKIGASVSNEKDPQKRLKDFADQIEAAKMGSVATKIVSALGVTQADKRYQMLLLGAKEAGVENYSCPALEKAWAEEAARIAEQKAAAAKAEEEKAAAEKAAAEGAVQAAPGAAPSDAAPAAPAAPAPAPAGK